MARSLSIVMAAFNEAEALPACARRTLEFLGEHVTDGELIIVDDGSTDPTPAVIEGIAKGYPNVTPLRLEKNSGMGAALLEGFARATKEWVTILPGDGQLDPYELLKFFAVCGDADLVTSRYANRKTTLWRRFLSRGLRVLIALILGTRAGTEGTYLIRRSVLEKLRPTSRSFLLNLEIPVRAKRGGYRVKTIYMNVSPRIAGVSKAATAGRILHTFRELIRLRVQLMGGN